MFSFRLLLELLRQDKVFQKKGHILKFIISDKNRKNTMRITENQRPKDSLWLNQINIRRQLLWQRIRLWQWYHPMSCWWQMKNRIWWKNVLMDWEINWVRCQKIIGFLLILKIMHLIGITLSLQINKDLKLIWK